MNNSILLDKLTEQEKEYALKILQGISNNDNSELNKLLREDYEEIPVSIDTFLHDNRYLGKGLTDDEGRFTLFPYWEKLLKDMFPNSLEPVKYNTLALTGSIGIGKSTAMVISGCYELYRMLCLRDPYVYYGIQPIDLITFALINITLDAAKGVAWSKMQNLLQSSPWFMSRGTISKSSQAPEWSPPKGIELIYGSKPSHIIGRALFWCGQDEVSFRQNMDVEKQKAAASELVNSASMRMQSRFMKGEKNPTLLVLASSKRTDQSFLETWIESKKKMDSKTTFVVDEPQWIIRTDKDSPSKFKVAIGDKFLQSEVISPDASDEEVNSYITRGYRILDVPMGYYESFLSDVDQALTDIAGISTTSSSSYISGARLSQIKSDTFENPFVKDIIEVGDAREDTAQYGDFFDLDKIDSKMKKKPLYIGLDLSLTGDKSGIGGIWIKGKRPPLEGQETSSELYFQFAFVVSVKAPKGHQVSFEKTRNFIYWLKKQGFNIKGITSDTYARSGVEQDLLAKGFNYEILSVDRLKDRICEPYAYFKNCIYEQRLLLPKKGINLLSQELVGLKRDNNSGKIDHDPSSINSKDSADAICQAIFNASKHGEEFARDYGEDLKGVVEFNQELGIEDYNQEFEQAIMEAHRTSVPVEDSFEEERKQKFGISDEIPYDIYNGIFYW